MVGGDNCQNIQLRTNKHKYQANEGMLKIILVTGVRHNKIKKIVSQTELDVQMKEKAV